MGDLGLFRDLDSAGFLSGFTAGGVLGANPEKAEDIVRHMFNMQPEDQVVLIRAIAYSGLPGWKGSCTACHRAHAGAPSCSSANISTETARP